MADEQIVTNIVATADFSNLISDLNRVTAALANLQQTSAATNRALAAQINAINNSFESNLRKTGQFSTHFVTLSSDVDKFGRNLDSGKLKLKDYFNTYKDHVRTSGGLIRDLARQQVQMQNAILQPLGRNSEGLMQFNVHVPRGLNEIKNKTAIARQELQIMNKVIQDGGIQLINWGKNTQWAGRQLSVGLTLPLVAFGKASATAFMEADQELTRLTKVYGGLAATSREELTKVRKDVQATAKELAAGYGASFKDTLSLAADIAATGKTGNELLGSIKETTRLAVLGEVDRQEAMKATLALQSAFKQNTDQLTESINFLNAVENQTSTTLSDLVEAIPKAGPVIEGLGGSVKDLALYLTAMREGGVNAAEGANALKSALASLINPTKVAKERFAGFGIDLEGIVTKNAGNLTQTILTLQSALDKLNPLQKQQALEQLFGKFQFSRMNALFENLGRQGSQTLQVLDLMKASTSDLAGIASRELGMVTESASGRFKRAMESLKADLASTGDQFLEVGTRLVNILDKVLNFANKLPDPIKKLGAIAGIFTAIAGPVIMLTGLFANFTGYLIKAYGHIKAFLKGGEGFKLLTPEILAAQKAGSLVEQTFYSDAKAAAALSAALQTLTLNYTELNAAIASGKISTGSTLGSTVSTTIGSPIVVVGGGTGGTTRGRVANPQNPLIGPEGRVAAHLNPRDPNNPATIFGFTLQPEPVNRVIGRTPQVLMKENLPVIEGVTGSRGVSTGVVAEEHSRYAALMATIGMQSKAEIQKLKKTIQTGGQVSADFIATFDDILPITQKLSQNAATQSAAIVAELEAGKITVEQARARIIQVNAQLESSIGAEVSAYAAATGRTIDVTKVPLVNQPVVNSRGKPNLRAMFRKGKKGRFGNFDIMQALGRATGTRTFGGPYSIETTNPQNKNEGGKIFYNNGEQVPGPNINADVVPAMLTPGEYVIRRDVAQQDPEGMKALNAGQAVVVPIQNANRGGEIQGIQHRQLGGSIYRMLMASLESRGSVVGGLRQRVRSASRPGEWSRSGASSRQFHELGSDITYHSLHRPSTSMSGWSLLSPYGQRVVDTEAGDVILHGASSSFRTRFAGLPRGVSGRAATPLVNREQAGRLGLPVGSRFEEGFVLPDNFVVFRSSRSTTTGKKFNSSLDSLNGADTRLWPGVEAEDMTSLAIQLRQSGVNPAIAQDILAEAARRLNLKVTRNPRVTGDQFGDYLDEAQKEAVRSFASRLNKGGRVKGFRGGGRISGAQYLNKAGIVKDFIGMPIPFSRVQSAREIAERISSEISLSRFKNLPITNTGHKIQSLGGLSVGGLSKIVNGVYKTPDGRLVVYKAVEGTRASLAEMRYSTLAREGHGLTTPSNQSIKVIADPTDPTGKRKILVIESKYDKKFVSPTGQFNLVQGAKQLLASAIRGDRDVKKANVSGNIVVDPGNAGVFSTASNRLEYAKNMRSAEEQILINIGAVKGGAASEFVKAMREEARVAGFEKWKKTITDELEKAITGYKKVIPTFKLNSEEVPLYQGMISRAEDLRNADWKKIYDSIIAEPKSRKSVPKREKGGPVNSGEPYLVGEKGPELFVPRSSGTIIPKYNKGGGVVSSSRGFYGEFAIDPITGRAVDPATLKPQGAIQRFAGRPGAGFITGAAGWFGGSAIGQRFGQAIGGDFGGQIGGIAGGFAGQAAAMSALSKVSGEAAGRVSLLSKSLSILSKLPGPFKLIAVILGVAKGIQTVNNKIEDHRKIINQAFTPTQDTVTKLNLKFNDLNQTLKATKDRLDAMEKSGRALYEKNNLTGIPGISLTIQQLNQLKDSVTKDFPELIDIFNKAKPNEVIGKAIQLKSQFIAGGMSAQDATNFIYALISASNDATMAVEAINNKGFAAVKTGLDAATVSLKTFINLVNSGNIDQLPSALNETVNALDQYNNGLIGTKNAEDKLITPLEAVQKTLKLINVQSGANKQLSIDQLAAIKKQYPELRTILSNVESIAGAYAKIKLYNMGITSGLDALGDKAAQAKLIIMTSVESELQSTAGPFADLAKSLEAASNKVKAGSTEALKAFNKTKDQITAEIKLRQKNIAKIKEESDARIKALQNAQEDEDALLQIKQKQLDYQDALAAGDLSAASAAQLEIQGLIRTQQRTAAIRAIESDSDARIKEQEAAIEALQNRLDSAQTELDKANTGLEDAQKKLASLQEIMNTAVGAMLIKINAIGRPLSDSEASIIQDAQKALKNYPIAAAALNLGAKVPTQEGLKYFGGGSTVDSLLKNALTKNGEALKVYISGGDKAILDLFKGKTLPTDTKKMESYNAGTAKDYSSQKDIKSAASAAAKTPGTGGTPEVVVRINDQGFEERFQVFKYKNSYYVIDQLGAVYPYDYKQQFVDLSKKPVAQLAAGGLIKGPGTPTSDSILTMARAGGGTVGGMPIAVSTDEFITKAGSVKDIGLENMYLMNQGGSAGVIAAAMNLMSKFKEGGNVNTGLGMPSFNPFGMGIEWFGKTLSNAANNVSKFALGFDSRKSFSKKSGMEKLAMASMLIPGMDKALRGASAANKILEVYPLEQKTLKAFSKFFKDFEIKFTPGKIPQGFEDYVKGELIGKRWPNSTVANLDFEFPSKQPGGMLHSLQVFQKMIDDGINYGENWMPEIGHLNWDPLSGVIDSLKISEQFRRQGLATELWNTAKSIGPIAHSVVRSAAGDAWARTVGGVLPELKHLVPPMATGGYINPSYMPNMKLPSFDSGVNYLNNDTIAQLHKAEAVIPADMNPFNPSATNPIGGSTYQIVQNITAAPGMDVEQLADVATRKMLDALKKNDYNNRAKVGEPLNMARR